MTEDKRWLKLRRVIHGGPISLSWLFLYKEDFIERCQNLLDSYMDEKACDHIRADLPVFWGDSDGMGGPSLIDDPLTVYVELPMIGSNPDEPPCWSFSLRGLINEGINDFDLDKPEVRALRDELRRLADLIDEEIERKKGEPIP